MNQKARMVISAFILCLSIAFILSPSAWAQQSSDNVALFLPFNENEGIVAHDISGFGNDGILKNDPSWTSVPRSGLEFNGINNYVEVPDSSSLDIVDEITVEILFKTSRYEEEWAISKGGAWSGVYSIGMSGGCGLFRIWVAGEMRELSSSTTVNDGRWHHLAMTYDGLTVKAYVDGKCESILNITGAIDTNDSPITIGTDPQYGHAFEGIIDEVRIYNQALSTDEIKSHYPSETLNWLTSRFTNLIRDPWVSTAIMLSLSAWTQQRSGNEVLYLPFNEGGGTIAHDNSGLSNDGILKNDPSWTSVSLAGNALEFNGINNYVEVPDSSSLDIVDEITVEILFKTSRYEEEWAISKGGAWGGAYSIGVSSGTKGWGLFRILIAGGTRELSSSTTVNDGRWHHLAMTYDGLTVKAYVDGKCEAVLNVTGTIDTNDSPITIGTDPQYGHAFEGVIDEVRIYNRALSADEIKSHYPSETLNWFINLIREVGLFNLVLIGVPVVLSLILIVEHRKKLLDWYLKKNDVSKCFQERRLLETKGAYFNIPLYR